MKPNKMKPVGAPNCRLCQWNARCFYQHLEEPGRKEWIGMRQARFFPEGNPIFYEGDDPKGVYIVCEGQVKLFKTTRTGNTLITRIVTPGTLIGPRSLFAGEPHAVSGESFTDATVVMISPEDFYNFLRRRWNAVLGMLKELSKGIRRGDEKARDIAFSPAKARLARELVFHAKKVKTNVRSVFIPRKELASLAGIAPETCVRILNKFEKKGWVKRFKGEIKLTNYEKIEGVARSSVFPGSQ
ncbi:Crp/Fnr family transcriptional regulator [Elusimicrobiota bacterium]